MGRRQGAAVTAVALAGAAALLVRLDAGEALARAWAAGPWLAPVAALTALSVAGNALGWGLLLPRALRPGAGALFASRVAAEAIGTLAPGGAGVGEPARLLWLPRTPIALALGGAALVADALTNLASTLAFGALGCAAAAALVRGAAPGRLLAAAGAMGAAGALLTLLAARLPIAGRAATLLARGCARLGWARGAAALRRQAGALDEALGPSRRWPLGALAGALGGHALARVVGIVEIALLLRGLGAPAPATTAVAIMGGVVWLNVLFAFVPAQVGVLEAGLAGLCPLLGLSPETGVALGLLRRARALAWSALGAALLAARARRVVGATPA